LDLIAAVGKATTLALALCLWASEVVSPSVAAAEELEREVRAGVTEAWKRVNADLLSRLAGTYSVVWEYEPGAAGPAATRQDLGTYEFLIVDSRMKVINRRAGGERVGAINPEYWFEIGRKDDKSRFQIGQLVPQTGTGGKQMELMEEYRAERFNEVLAPWHLIGYPFVELIQMPQFSIREARKRGDGTVRVDFTAAAGESPPLAAADDGSHLVLDPDRQWCVVAFEMQRSWGVERGEYEYEGVLDGFPRLRQMRVIARNNEQVVPTSLKGLVATKTITFSRLERPEATADVSGFRLSDYGFPEPNFKSRRSYVYVGYFLIAVSCLFCGWWASRRRKPRL